MRGGIFDWGMRLTAGGLAGLLMTACQPKPSEVPDVISQAEVWVDAGNTAKQAEYRLQRRTTRAYLDIREPGQNPAAASLVQLTNFDYSRRRQLMKPDVSPVADEIVYAVMEHNRTLPTRSRLYRLRFGTEEPQQAVALTNGRSLDLFPAYSADGARILFSRQDRGSLGALWQMPADATGNADLIVSKRDEATFASTAANGFVVFAARNRDEPRRSFLWRYDMGEAEPIRITEGLRPRLSPDGRSIVYMRATRLTSSGGVWATNRYTIWTMPLDDPQAEPVRLSGDLENLSTADPAFSPDGKWIAFTQNSRYRGNGDIFMMSLESGEVRRITWNQSDDDGPVFDRTGRYLIFRSNRGGAWNLFKIEVAPPPS